MMTTRPIKFIPLRDSALFRLRSPHKLADLLNLGLEELEALARSGAESYKQFESDKRWIETPLPVLKKVQGRVHRLLSQIEPPHYLFSGYKRRSAVGNASQHSGAVDMVKLDLRRFYPTSDGRRVSRLFVEHFQAAPHVAAILGKLCTIKGTKNAERCHLPTGGVTSPILAYFAYRDMFESLNALAERHFVTFTVMADDITFSGTNAHSVLKQAKQVIACFGLTANGRKQKLWHSSHNNKIVTGAVVTPKGLRVPKKQKDKIEELKRLLRNEESPQKRAKLYQRLHGSLASAGQLEPRFAVGARCTLAEWKRDKAAWREQMLMSGARKRIP